MRIFSVREKKIEPLAQTHASEARRLAASLRGDVHDERVLSAIAKLERERFVPVQDRDRAYDNVALPIGHEQTISQPLVVARMLELLELRGADRVLDVGTGSGYHAALLAILSSHVWTIERHPELSAAARRTLDGLGIRNVTFIVGDGSRGLAARAPFDAINVAAAARASVPPELEAQLALGGRLVAPLSGCPTSGRESRRPGVGRKQHLTLTRRTASGFSRVSLDPVRFVPLVRDP